MIFNDMPERITFNRRATFNIIKLVWAVLILYFWLKISVLNIWENTSLLIWKYYDEISPVDYEYNEDWANELWVHKVSEVEQEEKIDTYSDLDWENHEFELKYQSLCFPILAFVWKLFMIENFHQKINLCI